MGLRINDIVPNLTVTTDQGEITLHDWIGDSWAVIFSHPKDFTPVCTTEFGAVAQLADEWAARNTKVLGVSVDGVEEHKGWKTDIESFAGAKAGFPIVADTDLTLSKAFDMLPAEDLSDVRGSELCRNPARFGRSPKDLWRAFGDTCELGHRTGRDCRDLFG